MENPSLKRKSPVDKMQKHNTIVKKAKKQKNERIDREEIREDSPSYHQVDSFSSTNTDIDLTPPMLSEVSSPGASKGHINHQGEDVEQKDPASTNPKLRDALKNLKIRTNCPIVQNKWHRKFGPPNDWTSSPPPKGSEVFVGKIPRDLFEDELIPVLQKAGNLYEVRLMVESSGFNRGFAYVRYASKMEAEKAVAILNNFEIRSRHYLGVMKSVDNNRLFIGGIPKTRRQEELLEEMKRLTDDVLNVILYADVNDKNKNRGFAFVEYKSHTAAYSARQKLMRNPPLLWGSTLIKVDWAEPEREVDEQTMNKVRILYVRNLSMGTTDQQLRELFSHCGGSIERVKKIKDYAFVHFATREQAQEAMDKLQGYVLDKCEIDISWSKPVTNREEYQQRKAASKALSSVFSAGAPVNTAALGVSGETFMLSHKVRTAAGAQGYIASRAYSLRPRPNEEGFSGLQIPFVYPGLPYVQDLTGRNGIEHSIALPATTMPQTIYTPEKFNHIEELIAPSQDVYQLAPPQLVQRIQPLITPSAPTPYNVVSAPIVHNTWGGQSFIPAGNTAPTFIHASPYVVPAPAYAPMPVASAYSPQAFYGTPLMTQMPNMSGSNMSIDTA